MTLFFLYREPWPNSPMYWPGDGDLLETNKKLKNNHQKRLKDKDRLCNQEIQEKNSFLRLFRDPKNDL